MTSEGGLATRCSREDAPRQDGRAGGAHSGPAQKAPRRDHPRRQGLLAAPDPGRRRGDRRGSVRVVWIDGGRDRHCVGAGLRPAPT